MSPDGGILTIKGSGFSSVKSEMKIMVTSMVHFWYYRECFVLEDSWVTITEVKCMLPTGPGYDGFYSDFKQEDMMVKISVKTPGNLSPATSTCAGCVSG